MRRNEPGTDRRDENDAVEPLTRFPTADVSPSIGLTTARRA